MLENYKTVSKRAEAEIVEKKSRFISTVTPATTEEEALAFIDSLRKKYWNATHNVFAYQIGENNQFQRCSDDGEPSGTAGLPVLDVLRGYKLKNTAIVVTRYFGGTLLGTGGLVRAYGKAAKEGVYNAQIVEKVLYQQFSLLTDYTSSGKLQYEILQMGHIINDTIYTDKVEYIVLVKFSEKDKFQKEVVEISNGQCKIDIGKFLYRTETASVSDVSPIC